jgi:hypothetical protein
VSISSDDDTDSTEESETQFVSELDPDVDMRMEDDVDAPDGIDLAGDVDMERDGDDEVVGDDQEADEEEEDEDDGKEPRMIGQGEMVNPSADDVDTMVDDQPIVLPEQGQEMRVPQPQPPAPAPRPQTPEPRPRPRTPETHLLSRLVQLGHLTPQKRRMAVPTLREAEVAGTTSDVDVNQQLLIESAGGDSLSNVSLPDVPLPDVPLPDVPLPDIPLPDVPFPDVRADGSVGEE